MSISVVLVTIAKAFINIHVQVFVWTYALILLDKIFRSGVTGSLGRSLFDFLMKLINVFQRDCTILHSALQCKRVPSNCATSLPRLGMVNLFPFNYSNKCVVVFCCSLSCISLMTNDVEHFYVVI